MNLPPREFAYLYSEPKCSAMFKQQPEDFQVVELPEQLDAGEGGHLYLRVRKTGENTEWVARRLAAWCQLNPKDIGYAGKKDRHAVTEQWFSLPIPETRQVNWDGFGGGTIEIIGQLRRDRKLRLGGLTGNRFDITLRQVSAPEELMHRAERVAREGVPNYFGAQRFGLDGGNIDKGVALLEGRFKERQRHKRGIYISALRSLVFNHLLSEKINQQRWYQVTAGDALMFPESTRCLVVEADQQAEMQEALLQAKMHPTAPLWGEGLPLCVDESRVWELAQLEPYQELLDRLVSLGLRQERRSARLIPQQLVLKALSQDDWLLSFTLPAGAFATSVLREICRLEEPS